MVQSGLQTALALAALADPVQFFSVGSTVVFDNSAPTVRGDAARVVAFVYGTDVSKDEPFWVRLYKDPDTLKEVTCSLTTKAEIVAPNGWKCFAAGDGIALLLQKIPAGEKATFVYGGTLVSGNATFRRGTAVRIEPLVIGAK